MQPEIEADPKEGAGSGPEQDAGPASERESPPGDLASGPGLESPPERPAAMALQPATPAERAAPPSVAFLVLSVEVQILVAATIGGRAAGAPLRLREALKRTRQVFWRVVRGT